MPPAAAPRFRARLPGGAFLLVLAGALAVVAPAPARARDRDEAVERALKQWDAVARLEALAPRVDAARALAGTGSPEALDKLLDVYRHPGAHPEHLRELLAPILARAFGGPTHARELLSILRKELSRPEDAWLAWHVFHRWAGTDRQIYVQLAARAFVDEPFHRAAALEALAIAPSPKSLDIARSVLDNLPENEPERTVLAQSAARLWLAGLEGKSDVRATDVEPALTVLESEWSSPRTKLVIARRLARLLDSDAVWLDAGAWRRLLEERRAAKALRRGGYATESKTTPSFLGIRARGRNICYVIDVSGSMNMPIGDLRLPRAIAPRPRRGPATGGASPGVVPPGPEDDPDAWKGIDDLPWHAIRTRLDLVREALKASLRSLDEDQRFAIVAFSSDASPLPATRSPLRATKRNVEKGCRAVDGLSAAGSTNLHRGLELAFAFDDHGVDEKDAFVDLRHLQNGFDTIFVLSDGVPNMDSYGSGTGPRATRAVYAMAANIVLSAQRQNLFRHAEIHCIGMGSSPRDLLRDLADAGGGEARFLGR